MYAGGTKYIGGSWVENPIICIFVGLILVRGGSAYFTQFL
jgi:hypothetical protein